MALSHEFFFHIDKDESKKFIYYLSVKEYYVWGDNQDKKPFSEHRDSIGQPTINKKYVMTNFKITYEIIRLGNFHNSNSNYSRNRQNIATKSYRVYPEKFILKTSWYKTKGNGTARHKTTRFCAYHPFKKDIDPLYKTDSMFDRADIKYPYRVGTIIHKGKKKQRNHGSVVAHWLEVATELGTVNRRTNINRNETDPIYKTLKLENNIQPANEILKEYVLMDLDSLSKYFSGDRKLNFREMNIPNCLRHVYTLLDAYYKNNKKYLTMFRIVNAFMKPLSESEQVLKVELQNLLENLRKQKFPIKIEYNPENSKKSVTTTCEASKIIQELNEKDEAKIEDEDKITEIQNFLNDNKSLKTNADVMVTECPTFTLNGTKYPYTLKNLKKKIPNKKRKRDLNEESNDGMMMRFQYLNVESDEEISEEEVLYMSDLGYVSYSSESD